MDELLADADKMNECQADGGWGSQRTGVLLLVLVVAGVVATGGAARAAAGRGAGRLPSPAGFALEQQTSETPGTTPGTRPPPTASATLGSGRLPDLTVTSLWVGFDPALPCSAANAAWGVSVGAMNVGSAPAAPFVLGVMDRRYRVLGLAGREAISVWFMGGQQGEVEAIVDVDREVLEEREDNNRLTQLLPVPSQPPPCTPTPSPTPGSGGPPLPDLVARAEYGWDCPCWPCHDSPPFGVVCVANEGSTDAGRFRMVTALGQVREVQDLLGLAAGGEVCRDIPSVSVELIVDSAEWVTELDEGNNRSFGRAPTYTPPPPCRETPTVTPIPPPPDLVVDDYEYSRVPISWRTPGTCNGGCTCALPGEYYSHAMTARVSNLGAGPAGQFVVRTEPLVDAIWSVPGLGARQTTWLGWQEGWADAVIVDADNRVDESDESNNRRAIPATPVYTEPPPCTQAAPTESPTPSTTSPPGPTASITRTPSPTGTPTTGLAPLRVYLPNLPQR